MKAQEVLRGSEGGCGAINEKVCVGARASDAAMVMHATFGLDHYPNYLQRWQMSDVEELEMKLRAQLHKVEEEKEKLRQKLLSSSSFPCRLATAPAPQDIWDKRFLELIDGDGKLRLGKLNKILSEEADGVYSFPLLQPSLCQQIVSCANDFAAFTRQEKLEGKFDSERPAVLDMMKLG